MRPHNNLTWNEEIVSLNNQVEKNRVEDFMYVSDAIVLSFTITNCVLQWMDSQIKIIEF